MSDRDTCSIEFKTGRSSDIYGYVENGSVDVALVSDLLNSRRIVPFPVFREPFVFAGGESWRETGRVTPDMLDPEEQIRLPWNPEYDIWHMMIDETQQGKGYGKAALKLILDYIEEKPFGNSDRVVLTCNKNNTYALNMYKSLGFEMTGNEDEDELELALTV